MVRPPGIGRDLLRCNCPGGQAPERSHTKSPGGGVTGGSNRAFDPVSCPHDRRGSQSTKESTDRKGECPYRCLTASRRGRDDTRVGKRWGRRSNDDTDNAVTGFRLSLVRHESRHKERRSRRSFPPLRLSERYCVTAVIRVRTEQRGNKGKAATPRQASQDAACRQATKTPHRFFAILPFWATIDPRAESREQESPTLGCKGSAVQIRPARFFILTATREAAIAPPISTAITPRETPIGMVTIPARSIFAPTKRSTPARPIFR